MSVLIKNGRVLDPATNTDEVMDLFIGDDGLIEKRAKKIAKKADSVIDAKNCFVMPGFIDLHEHMRDPGFTQKEDVISGAKAAAAGGYTTIVAMPNTKPVVDNADVVNYVHIKAKDAPIHVLQAGAITKGMKGEELSDIESMVQAGIPAISEDGKSVMDSGLYRRAMKMAAKLEIPVLAHCEDINLVQGGVVNWDENAKRMELNGITNSVEDVIIARDIMLAKDTGCALHLCHCSTKDSVAMVRHAKLEHINVTAEVCPHHFTLTSDDIIEGDTNYKMNPPLRTKADVEALKQGLKDGIMDVIATDHAPHTADEKNTSMQRAPFGIVGSETAAALTYTELVLGGYLTPLQMAEKMSYNPARVLHSNRGSLEEGKPADVVIFDPNETYVIDKTKLVSRGHNTPFHGRKVTGRVRTTIVDGNVVYSITGSLHHDGTER